MDRWIGCNALITGATSGIGAAIAKKFVENGINVVGLGRNIEALQELSEQLASENAKLYPMQCDVMDEQQILDTLAWMEAEVGPVSILVNNAAVFNGSTNLSEVDGDILKQTFYTNCLALCVFTREVIKSMKSNGIDGLIIYMSSIAARYVPFVPFVNYNLNVYPATKFATRALADTLRLELRKEKSRIRITCISPGITATNMFRDHLPEDAVSFATMPCLAADEIAETALYVLRTPPHVEVDDVIVRPMGEFI